MQWSTHVTKRIRLTAVSDEKGFFLHSVVSRFAITEIITSNRYQNNTHTGVHIRRIGTRALKF